MSGVCVFPGCGKLAAHSTTCYCSAACSFQDEGRKYAISEGKYWCNGSHGPPWVTTTGLHVTENDPCCPDSPILERLPLAREVCSSTRKADEEVSNTARDMFTRWAKKSRVSETRQGQDVPLPLGTKDEDKDEEDEEEWVTSGVKTAPRRARKISGTLGDLTKFRPTTSSTQPGRQTSILNFVAK